MAGVDRVILMRGYYVRLLPMVVGVRSLSSNKHTALPDYFPGCVFTLMGWISAASWTDQKAKTIPAGPPLYQVDCRSTLTYRRSRDVSQTREAGKQYE